MNDETMNPNPTENAGRFPESKDKAVPVLILASASPARRKVLQGAGLDPIVQVSQVDEDALLAQLRRDGATPGQQVLALAQAKARFVADSIVRSGQYAGQTVMVVGCDSMLEFHGEVLGKPHTADLALQRVRALSGDSGVLHTGHWAVKIPAYHQATGGDTALETPGTIETRTEANPEETGGREVGETASTTVNFEEFSEAEAVAYVASGEPLEVAGSFTIDGLGGAFIRGIEGDSHNVIGISLPLLRRLVGELGIFWPSLWEHGRFGD